MFSIGFVQFRRGILEHINDGRLSTIEFAALVCLILLADIDSGRGKINGPLLRYYLPDLSSDAAQRTLSSLDRKGYIYRQNPSSCKRAYAYWVNKYEVTTGPHKLRRICLSKVAVSKDVNDIRYVDPATEGATVPATHGATQGANSNKNREEKHKKREVAAAVSRDSLNSVLVLSNGTKTGTVSGAMANGPEPGTANRQSKLDALAAILKNRVGVPQSVTFTEKEASGLESLDQIPLQQMSDALDWALQEEFWSTRVGGAGALKSLLRNLPTIQRQMAAEKPGAVKVKPKQLKAASVAAKPNKAFAYEGEVL
jgi:hypothetical protein